MKSTVMAVFDRKHN